jgi:hypothetical protein
MKEFFPGFCIPSTGMCRIDFAISLAKMMTVFMRVKVLDDTENQRASLRMVESSGISTNREQLVMDCLNDGCTHICFMDEDMKFDPFTLHRIARHKKPMVVCNYRIRKKGGDFSAMSLSPPTRVITNADSTGLEPCAFAGFGFSLIAREVFEQIPHPWFPIIWSDKYGRYSTEDKPFCEMVRKRGYEIYVDHDASKMVSHIGTYDFKYDDNGANGECYINAFDDDHCDVDQRIADDAVARVDRVEQETKVGLLGASTFGKTGMSMSRKKR